jgi:hypothetical protein
MKNHSPQRRRDAENSKTENAEEAEGTGVTPDFSNECGLL